MLTIDIKIDDLGDLEVDLLKVRIFRDFAGLRRFWKQQLLNERR